MQSRKRDKSTIAKTIVAQIRNLNGRFLKMDGENTSGDPSATVWVDVGDKRATEKTSQALREGLSGKMRDIVHQSGKGLKDLKETGVVTKKGEVPGGAAGVARPAVATVSVSASTGAATAAAATSSSSPSVPATGASASPNETSTDQGIKKDEVKPLPTTSSTEPSIKKENGETATTSPTNEKSSDDDKGKDDDVSDSVAI